MSASGMKLHMVRSWQSKATMTKDIDGLTVKNSGCDRAENLREASNHAGVMIGVHLCREHNVGEDASAQNTVTQVGATRVESFLDQGSQWWMMVLGNKVQGKHLGNTAVPMGQTPVRKSP